MDAQKRGFPSQSAAAASAPQNPGAAASHQRTNSSNVATAPQRTYTNTAPFPINNHRQIMASAVNGLAAYTYQGQQQQAPPLPPKSLHRPPLQTNGYPSYRPQPGQQQKPQQGTANPHESLQQRGTGASHQSQQQKQTGATSSSDHQRCTSTYPGRPSFYCKCPRCTAARTQPPPRHPPISLYDPSGHEFLEGSSYAISRMQHQPILPPGVVSQPPPPGAPYTQLMQSFRPVTAAAAAGPLPSQQNPVVMAPISQEARLLNATTDQHYDEMEQVMVDAQKSLANGPGVTLLASDLTEIPLQRQPPDHYDPLFLLHHMESFEVVVVHRSKPPMYCQEVFNEEQFCTASDIVLIQCRFCHGSCQTDFSSPFLAVDPSMTPDAIDKLLLPMIGHTMSCPRCPLQRKLQIKRTIPSKSTEHSEVGTSSLARCKEWLAWIKSQLVYEQVLDMVPPGRHIEFWVPCTGKELASMEPEWKKRRFWDKVEEKHHKLVSSAREHDVLYGFEGARACPGNQSLLRLVQTKRADFSVAEKPDKIEIVSGIIERVRFRGGRFLMAPGESGFSRGLTEMEIQKSVESMLQKRSSYSVSFVAPVAATPAPGSKVCEVVQAPVRDLISGRIRGYEPLAPNSRQRNSASRQKYARRTSCVGSRAKDVIVLDPVDASSLSTSGKRTGGSASLSSARANGKSTTKGSATRMPGRSQNNVSKRKALPSQDNYALQSMFAKGTNKVRAAYGQDSDSKYSMARMMERVKQDGSIATISTPVRNKNGLFKRPAGRGRAGMEWDDVRGVWVPCGHDFVLGKAKPAKFSPDIRAKSSERPSKNAVYDIDMDDWVTEETIPAMEVGVKPPHSAAIATNGTRARGVSSSDED